jgi:predicted NBD/HSP70 family sugar kinase
MMDLERIPVTSPAAVAIFTRILTHGPIGRAEVARDIGLSQAAVTKAVTPLAQAGYVLESGPSRADANVGRPVSPLVVDASRAHIVGVKITRGRVYAVLTNLAADILESADRDVAEATTETVIDRIAELVAQLTRASPSGAITGVGVSVSGDVDSAAGIVRHSPLMGWTDVHLAEAIERRVDLPVIIENDVRALTVLEQLFGRGTNARSFAMVTIGEGIGCGIFVNGDVVEGSHGVSGEIGHLPLGRGDLQCSCGRRGCVETIASSQAILRRIREESDREELSMDDAVALARTGNKAARDAFADAGEVIGAALAALVNLIGPELVIIAGEGVVDYDLYDERLRTSLLAHAFGAAADCEVALRSHTFDDWARGAAVSVIRKIARGERR